jgi:hypothetical protein
VCEIRIYVSLFRYVTDGLDLVIFSQISYNHACHCNKVFLSPKSLKENPFLRAVLEETQTIFDLRTSQIAASDRKWMNIESQHLF